MPTNAAAPFKTIVAGSDGHRGRVAASLAQTIATVSGARLLLVGVEYDLPLPLIETHAEARDAMESELRSLRDEFAPEAQTRIAVDASPAHALRRIAEAERADLIVVGSMHRGRLQRFTSADRAMQVLHGAPCAVAVAPDHLVCRSSLERIGVGIDGSPESRMALDLALELAGRSGATLQLLAVASDMYPGSANLVAGASFADIYQQVIDGRVHMARDEADRLLERCASAGVTASADVRLGDPARELTGLSAECDLLVLGSRRWGPVRRLALGSTAERVIRDASCPVLVPPRHALTEHEEEPAAARARVVF